MTNNPCITSSLIESGMSRLCRTHAVQRLSIEGEIQTLMITASYASELLSEGMNTPPEDFFTCVEEMKEVMESIDLKSLDFEQRAIAIKRNKRRVEAKSSRQSL